MKHLLGKKLKNRTLTLDILELGGTIIIYVYNIKYILTHFSDEIKSILIKKSSHHHPFIIENK